MKLLTAIIACLACTAFAPAKETARLWVDLEPGWSERYKLQSRIQLEADDEIFDRLDQTVTMRIAAVAREDGDAGRATVRATVERIEITHASAGDTVQVAFPLPEDERAAEGSAALARIYATLHEAVLEFEILPSGRARLIAGLETTLTAARAADETHYARLLGVFAPGAIERTVASIITLDPHRQERSAGDAWHDEQSIPILSRSAQVVTEYTLGAIRAGEAQVTGEITVAIEPGAQPTPTEPRITIAEHSGDVHARWDTAASRLIERRSEMQIVLSAALATEPPIESQTKATSRLTITLGSEPAPER